MQFPTNLMKTLNTYLTSHLSLLVKNSKFPDIQFIYDKFKAFINVNAFDGLSLRLAIQKYKPVDIRIMLNEWGCDPFVRNHPRISL